MTKTMSLTFHHQLLAPWTMSASCYCLLPREVIPLTQTGRLKSSQQKFLGTCIHVGVVSELLSCLHCCTVQPQEPYSRDAEGFRTWFCGHILYSEVTLRRRVVGEPVTGIRWQQPEDSTAYWVTGFRGKVGWNPACLSKDLKIFF